MGKVAKRCLIALILFSGLTSIIVGVALLANSGSDNAESESEGSVSYGTRVVKSAKGVEFTVPAEWIIDEQPSVSQAIMFHNLVDYENGNINAISITTSWVDRDFDISGYAKTFGDALSQSSSVASASLASFSIGDKKVYYIKTVNNGAFGGYMYFMKDNIIVEVLFGTQNPDDLETYQQDVNNIIASMKFTGKVKREDFPEPSEDESSSVSKVESSNTSSEGSKSSAIDADVGVTSSKANDTNKSETVSNVVSASSTVNADLETSSTDVTESVVDSETTSNSN